MGSNGDHDFQSVLERISDLGSWSWSFASGRHWWSDQTYRILGFRPGEIEPSVPAWFERVHPDDRDRVVAESAAATMESSSLEYRIVRADGTLRYVRAQAAVVEKSSGTHLVGSIQDVSEARLRQLQIEEARDLAESLAHVGSWTWSTTTGEVACSPELWDISGLEPGEPSMEVFDSIIHPDDLSRVLRVRQHAVDTGEALPVEVRIRRPDGQERIVVFRGRPRENGFLGIFQDVTEQRRLEAQVRWSETLQALGRLAGGVAHDFNNLLTVVLGHARVLHAREPNEDLRAIIDAAESGGELTRRLLIFGSGAPVEPKPVELENAIGDTTRMLCRLLGDQLAVHYQPSTQMTRVWVDPALLHRVVLGVAVNARDTLCHGGELTICTEPNSRDGRAGVLVTMTDNGSGIDSSEAPTEQPPLGLAMVRNLVTELGGELSVDATPGVGTVVLLWLPRTDREAIVTKPNHAVDRTGLRVLVVEDEPLVRRLIIRVLERAGYRVHLTSGPAEALATDFEFDFLLTDLTMPDGGGRRVVNELRKKKPNLPVLYLTGFAPKPEALDAPVLLKPFRPSALVAKIESVIAAAQSTK